MRDDDDNLGRSDREWVPDEALAALRMERDLTANGETEEALSRRLLREAAPQAALSLIHMATHGSTERVRMDASKYVLERVLGKVGDDAYGAASSPLESFLQNMTSAAEEHANASAAGNNHEGGE
jgi:hypothetical protein